MIDKLADSLTTYFKKDNNLNEEQIEKINYVLKVLLSEIFKLTILLTLFLLIGKLNWILFSLSILLSIRIFSGGTHFNNSINCLFFTLGFFTLACIIFPLFNLSRLSFVILSLIGYILIAVKSPSPSPKRPIISKKRRCYLKFLAIFFSVLWLYILFYVVQNEYLFRCGTSTIFLQGIQLIQFKRR